MLRQQLVISSINSFKLLICRLPIHFVFQVFGYLKNEVYERHLICFNLASGV
jgi:hypothetical protein